MDHPRLYRPVATFLVALCLCASPAFATEGFESAPRLFPSDVLAPELLAGPLHTVVGPIILDGFVATVAFDTPHGHMRSTGLALLPERLNELSAIDALGRVEKSTAFGDALAKAAAAPVELAGKLLTDPGNTLENVGSGIGKVLGQAGNLVRSGVDSVADTVSDMTADGKFAAGDDALPPAAASDPFGYNKARRQWAQRLDVDPYSGNPVLRQLLDDIAAATFAGSFAIDAPLSIVAAPVKYAVGFDADGRDAVWNLSPGEIEARNETRLAAMDIAGRPVRDFFRNTWFSPTLQTRLVGALERLGKTNGRNTVITAAARIRGEMHARQLLAALDLLGSATSSGPLNELWPETRHGGPLLLATRIDGELLVALPADFLYWNEAAATLTALPAAATATRRTLLISGTASARARQELERAGWSLLETGNHPGNRS